MYEIVVCTVISRGGTISLGEYLKENELGMSAWTSIIQSHDKALFN